jgi:hypothetical protein
MIAVHACICEAALWTDWAHRGNLSAHHDGTLIVLDVKSFGGFILDVASVLVQLHTLKYARGYVMKMNERESVGERTLSDIDKLDLTEGDLDEVHIGEESEHWIFLSHYKIEAGTEATLMHQGLTSLIRRDTKHPAHSMPAPVFIDSEDLDDLTTLENHVVHCNSLVALLTPGYLARPWCLFEIVKAVREGVHLIPVEVQRPGLRFVYPSEEFYQQLLNGQILSVEDTQLLQEQGVELPELERCIRSIFMKIALPFSPHKSTEVRDAELSKIVRACEKVKLK